MRAVTCGYRSCGTEATFDSSARRRVGTDAVEIPKLFHKFHQADRTSRRSFGGLGLGLAIARTLVDAHAGSIEARSPGIGQGASFVVKLPLAAPTDSTRKPAVESGDPLAPNGKIAGVKVLYVDDDPYMLELVSIMLGERGAVVRTAASVNEAIDLLASFIPDVLVSDIAMADRDGYDLVREVRGMPAPLSTIPVIALTAHARLDEVKDVLDAGFSRHMAKPSDPEALARMISELARARVTASHP